MQPTVGDIFEGKVTGITKFGAFVTLPDGKNGLVHISEIANSYVSDVSEHLSQGQNVRVRVIGINPEGKINLSIKQALETVAAGRVPNARPERDFVPAARPAKAQPAPPGEPSFEDKLKQFMHDSDSRISDSRMYSDKKSGYRRRRD